MPDNSLSNSNFNVGIIPPVPAAPVGSNPGKVTKAANPQDPSTVREVPGLYSYNPETGLQEKARDWSDKLPAKEPSKKTPVKKTDSTEETKPNRHQEWKANQEQKKEAREAAKADKLAKQEALVLPALRKGDFAAVAKALNITVPEAFTLFNNAALSIPTKEAELTLEQKKAKDEADYRNSLESKVKSFEQYQYDTVKKDYIRENIDPVFSNKEKYELLNASQDVAKVKSSVYEYMNQHYNETGEVIPVQDILDTIEQQLDQQAIQAVEQYKGIKKYSKYFTQAEKDQAEIAQSKDSLEDEEDDLDLPEEEEPSAEEEEYNNDNSANFTQLNHNVFTKTMPKNFGLMTDVQRLAYLRKMRK